MHLFSEADCPRLPVTEGMTVPIVAANHVMSQLMLDIKMSQLASWTTSNLLYDDSVGKLYQFRRMVGLEQITILYYYSKRKN
jgi:hypothetical protein